MCRLFGLTAGTVRVPATFWLLDAPDSLEAQSRRNPDGSGIGFFAPDGSPVLDKQPEPAFSDEEFIREAKRAESTTFVAHVRCATAGGRTVHNTHPFAMHGRDHGAQRRVRRAAAAGRQLGSYLSLVGGDTDSERFFALITQQADAQGGDLGAGIDRRGPVDRRPAAGVVAEHGHRHARTNCGRCATRTSMPCTSSSGPAGACGRPARAQRDLVGARSGPGRRRRRWSSRPRSLTGRAAGACSPPASSCTCGPT